MAGKEKRKNKTGKHKKNNTGEDTHNEEAANGQENTISDSLIEVGFKSVL